MVWLSPDNVVIYDDPARKQAILAALPEARALENGYVAAPATLHNLQILRWLGLPVPPPLAQYDWPGRFKPFESQQTTANFLAVHPRAFVLSDMGTGKTNAALWAADYVMAQYPGVRCLIVAPLSTLQRVWADAVFRHLVNRRSAVVLHGEAAKRRELLAKPFDFYIINHDGLSVIKDQLAKRPDIRIVILDEAAAYRDAGTKRHKLARALLLPRDYLWLMTGTPTPNGPVDAYGLAKLVNNAHGESLQSYRNRVMIRIDMWKWVPKQGSHAAAYALMQPAIRYNIEDCVDLPPTTTQTRDAELSAAQREAYRRMQRDLQLTLKEGKPITAVNEGVLRWKLIQIACGAVYGTGENCDDRVTYRLDCAPRIAVLREVMTECARKIIVFAPLTGVIDLLYEELSKEYSCAIVRGQSGGGPTPKERSEIFRAFEQDENPRVLIAHPRTMAHGLSLVAADTIIWYAPHDSTELYLQACKRIARPGQTRPTVIVHLAATKIEREVYHRLASNQSLQGLVLQMARGEI